MKKEYVLNNLEEVEPSPIAPRTCECGCRNQFQPRRHDHIYINKKHGDYYHYHNVKKPKRRSQNEIEKMHRKNDRICAKYVESCNSDVSIHFWESILSDGFNAQYMQGTLNEDGDNYVLTYNYMYTLFNDKGITKIKIKKR
jgi:hypothetical protein